MKTERRHELQKNELADVLGKEITALRPYWKAIIGGVIAVVAVGIALIAYSQSQKSKQQAAWKPFFAAQSKSMVDRDLDALRNVARESEGTSVAPIADLLVGDRELAEGIRLLYVNRTDADPHLTKAAESYERAAKMATSSQLELKMRGLLGLASAQESLRNVEKARAALEEAQKAAPNSVFGKEAGARLASLKEHEQWYVWFKEQAPVSPHTIPPAGAKPTGDSPFKLKEVPGSPDINFNFPIEGKLPPATEKPLGPPPADPKAPETPAPSDPAKPADTKPEDAKPGDAKPADAKPAETPADPKPAEAPKTEGAAKPAEAPKTPDKPATPEATPTAK